MTSKSQATTATPSTPAKGPLIGPQHRLLFSNVLLGSAVAAGGAAVWVALTWGTWAWPCTLYWIGLSFSCLFVGLWARFYEPVNDAEANDAMRMFVLAAGGLAGFLTAFLGVAVALAMYGKIFVGGLEAWRLAPAKVFGCFLCLFGGMGLMFASLLQGRSVERNSAGLRRLLYGYNAVLTGMLLLTILGLINLLSYVNWGPFRVLGQKWDWTASQIHSLSDATEKFLRELEQPVLVYSMVPSGDIRGREVERFLQQCDATAPPDKFDVKTLERDFDEEHLERVFQKYNVPVSYGLLVVYGKAPAELHEFIPITDVLLGQRFRDAQGKIQVSMSFRGEPALMKTLTFLAGGKRTNVIYFTQGNGEPELSNPAVMPGAQGPSLADLQDRLTRANYEVRPLRLKPGDDTVPDDASLVVVAAPSRGLPESAVRALNEYMEPTNPKQTKGKLIALFDVARDPSGKGMAVTGLEDVVGHYGLRVSNRRLLYARRDPTQLTVLPVPSSNPISLAFLPEGRPLSFLFTDARALVLPERGTAGRSRVEPLLSVLPRWATVQIANFGDAWSVVQPLLGAENRSKLDEVRDREEQMVAAAVVESSGSVPHDAAHAGVVGKGDVPRMVVFGDTTWITDGTEGNAKLNGDLFLSCVNWLRQRPDLGQATDAKERLRYSLQGKVTPQTVSHLTWLPMLFLLLAIVALGGGIWVVRRR